MLCSKCGYENADRAVYCIQCGHRLDGQVSCPHCETLNPEEAKFCMACGKPIQAEAQPAVKSEAVQMPQAQDKKTADWRKILKYCAGGSAMFGVLFTLIFVFCLGFTERTVGVSGNAGLSVSNEFFYVYFGKVYTDIAKVIAQLENTAWESKIFLVIDGYVNAVLGTLASAATLICVLAFSGVAIYRFVCSLKGKKTKSYFRPAATAYFSFVIGACCLLALNHMSASTSNASATVSLNGATVAGMVLGAIFLFAGIALQLAQKGKELLMKERLCNYITSVIGLIFSVVLLGVLPLASIKAVEDGTSLSAGASYWMQLLANLYIRSYNLSAPIGQLILAIVIRVVQLLAILLVGILAVRFTRNVLKKQLSKKRNNIIPVAVIAHIFSIAYLVLNIIFSTLCKEPLGMEEASFFYIPAIVCIVYSVQVFAVSIVNAVLTKPSKTAQEEPAVQADEEAPQANAES